MSSIKKLCNVMLELLETNRFANMKSFLSDEQLDSLPEKHKVIAGVGHKTPIQNIDRLIRRHGGSAENWQKITSPSMRDAENKPFELHAYRNKDTGEIVNQKTKIKPRPVRRDIPKIKEILGDYAELIGKVTEARISGLPKKTYNAPEGFDNHAVIADMYKKMNPAERHSMLYQDLPNWPEEAKIHFSKVALHHQKYGLEPQHALEIWNAATGGTQFDSKENAQEFINAVKWSKTQGWEPESLKRVK